jgi:hypothetical protein
MDVATSHLQRSASLTTGTWYVEPTVEPFVAQQLATTTITTTVRLLNDDPRSSTTLKPQLISEVRHQFGLLR